MSARGTMLLESGVWRNTAKCREIDPTVFFPLGRQGALYVRSLQPKRSVVNVASKIFVSSLHSTPTKTLGYGEGRRRKNVDKSDVSEIGLAVT